MSRVALFDLDHTLLDCNSGRLWMNSEYRQGRLSWRDVLWGSGWLLLYGLGWTKDLEKPYEQAIATVRGLEEEVIRARTQAWFEKEVRGHLRPGALQALQRHREAGDQLVLATSGSSYTAECAVQAFGLDDMICTYMEIREGRFTGRVSSFALGHHKRDRTQEWAESHDIALSDCVFYTDSFSDVDLMREVGEPVAVHPDRRLANAARQRGWPIVDWGAS